MAIGVVVLCSFLVHVHHLNVNWSIYIIRSSLHTYQKGPVGLSMVDYHK